MPFVIFAEKIYNMHVVSAREFRSNQGKFLLAARNGQSVLLKSRYGNFKISPITEEDNLTNRLCQSLQEIKLMETGQLKSKSAREFLNEL